MNLIDRLFYFVSEEELSKGHSIVATSTLNKKIIKNIEKELEPYTKLSESKIEGLNVFSISSNLSAVAFLQSLKGKDGQETLLSQIFVLDTAQFEKINYDPFLLKENLATKVLYGIIRKGDISKIYDKAEKLNDFSSKPYNNLVDSLVEHLQTIFHYVENKKLITQILSSLASQKKVLFFLPEIVSDMDWLRGILYLLPKQIRRKIYVTYPACNILQTLKDHNVLVTTETIFKSENIKLSDISQDVVVVNYPKLPRVTTEIMSSYVNYVVNKLIDKPFEAFKFVINLEKYLEKYAKNSFDLEMVNKYLAIQKQIDAAIKFKNTNKYKQAIDSYLRAAEVQSEYSMHDALKTTEEALQLAKQVNENKFYYSIYSKLLKYKISLSTSTTDFLPDFLHAIEDIAIVVEKLHLIDLVLEEIDKKQLPVLPLFNELLKYIKKTKEPDLFQKYYDLAFERYEQRIDNNPEDTSLVEEYGKHIQDYLQLLFSLERYDVILEAVKSRFNLLISKISAPYAPKLLDLYTIAINRLIKDYKKLKDTNTGQQNIDFLAVTVLEFCLSVISSKNTKFFSNALDMLYRYLQVINYYPTRLDFYRKFIEAITERSAELLSKQNTIFDILLWAIRDLHGHEESELIYQFTELLTNLSFFIREKFYPNLTFAMKIYLYKNNIEGFSNYLRRIRNLITKDLSYISEYSQALSDFVNSLKNTADIQSFFEIAFREFLSIHFTYLNVPGLLFAWKQYSIMNAGRKDLLTLGVEEFKQFISSPQITRQLKPIQQFVLQGHLCNIYMKLKETDLVNECREKLYDIYSRLSIKPTTETVPYLEYVATLLVSIGNFEEYLSLKLALAKYFISKNILEKASSNLEKAIKVFIDRIGDDKTKLELNEKTVKTINNLIISAGYSPSTKKSFLLWFKYISKFTIISATAWNYTNMLISTFLDYGECREPAKVLVEALKSTNPISAPTHFTNLIKVAETVANTCLRYKNDLGFSLYDQLVRYAKNTSKIKSYFIEIMAPIEAGIHTPPAYKLFLTQREKFKTLFLADDKLKRRFAAALSKAMRTGEDKVVSIIKEIMETYGIQKT